MVGGPGLMEPNYPSFKRKWAMYERTHLQQQSEKDKVQQFMEYCLEKEVVDFI